MLRWRLLLGTLLVAALVLLVWLDYRATLPGTYLFPVALVAATLAAGEIHHLLTIREQRPLAWVVYGGTFLVVAATGVPHFWKEYPGDVRVGTLGWPLSAMAAVIVIALVAEVIRYEPPSGAALNAALAVFAVAYAGLLLSFVIQLRFLSFPVDPHDTSDLHARWGSVALVSLLVVVKMTDVGAYTVGRLVGRHKLAPALSPGKTIEGVVGGLVFAAGSSLLVFKLLAPWMIGTRINPTSWLGALVYGVVLGIAGVAGDLAESMLKRDAGQKDSSRWIPGFGGGLDLLDSLLMAAPVAYVLWVVGVVGPRGG